MSCFFSIIIPTFNRSNVLPRAVNSVLCQTFHDFEIIIVDDGSTDDAQTLVRSQFGDRVVYVYQQNAGVCAARNHGAKLASGKFLVFLDSDDWLQHECLRHYHQALSGEGTTLALGTITYFSLSGKAVKQKLPKNYMQEQGQSLPGAFAISRELFLQAGSYDDKLTYAENSDLFLRLKLSKVILPDHVSLVKQTGVCKILEDGVLRRDRYMLKRYESVKYFIQKHQKYLASSKDEYIGFHRVLAVSALYASSSAEARGALMTLIKQFPALKKTYAQYVLFLFPPIARWYYTVSALLWNWARQKLLSKK